jgi:hypothetical protein
MDYCEAFHSNICECGCQDTDHSTMTIRPEAMVLMDDYCDACYKIAEQRDDTIGMEVATHSFTKAMCGARLPCPLHSV